MRHPMSCGGATDPVKVEAKRKHDAMLDALRKCAALEDDAERISYPLKVRFRLATFAARKALEEYENY